MDLRELSVVAVQSLVKAQEEITDELLDALANDSRSQVREIGKRLERKVLRESACLRQQEEMLGFERRYHARGLLRVAGVDEAGRGPLAGPVVAAAVIFPDTGDLPRARDSKTLSPENRETLYDEIMEAALAVGVAEVGHEEIDRLNIYNASLLAMTRACEALDPGPEVLLVDGNLVLRLEDSGLIQEALVKGDGRCLSIAAASVVAKVHRDRLMKDYDRTYPGYGFERHKGYPTSDHLRALKELGPCPIHRRSFEAVARCGRISSPRWRECFDNLSRCRCPEELEREAGKVRAVRSSLTPAELSSLRVLYRRRRESFRDHHTEETG